MSPSTHVPSLTHLRDFVRARVGGRPTHIVQDRAQVNASAEDRIFSFVYERFLTSTITHIEQGPYSLALERAHEEAPARMGDSYRAASKGMTALLREFEVVGARRRQRNVIVLDPQTGESLVSLRVHLLLELPQGQTVAAHMYFSERALTEAERAIMDTAVALAAQQLDDQPLPAVAMVRSGHLNLIPDAALSPERLDMLRVFSADYQAVWDSEE